VELEGDWCVVVVQTISERTASERALPIAVTPNHRRSDQAITQFSQNWIDCKKTSTIYKNHGYNSSVVILSQLLKPWTLNLNTTSLPPPTDQNPNNKNCPREQQF
jgi:hypothetical protein